MRGWSEVICPLIILKSHVKRVFCGWQQQVVLILKALGSKYKGYPPFVTVSSSTVISK
jgi:hypothetical protein